MKLYRFSPISTKDELLDAINYIAEQTTKLAHHITGNLYHINSLTVFAHYSDEFEDLKKITDGLGEFIAENNGPFVKLNSPIVLPYKKLEILRIRKPDPYRMQVGCNDFEISDYQQFKEKYLEIKKDNLRLIERQEYEMIEFFHPDYDVLSYVISKKVIL